MNTIGERIAALRNHRGLTQAELGEAIGESKQTIYKYERGIITNIPLQKVEAIARALRCPPVALTGWEGQELVLEDPVLQKQHEEINDLFDRLPPELRTHYLALLKGLAQASPTPDDPKGSG